MSASLSRGGTLEIHRPTFTQHTFAFHFAALAASASSRSIALTHASPCLDPPHPICSELVERDVDRSEFETCCFFFRMPLFRKQKIRAAQSDREERGTRVGKHDFSIAAPLAVDAAAAAPERKGTSHQSSKEHRSLQVSGSTDAHALVYGGFDNA